MNEPRPDDKNWTWVLERPCPDCGFDASDYQRRDLGPAIRANVSRWRELFGRGEIVRTRPKATAERGEIWSALEYGAHVRDALDVFADRVELMLKEDSPTFKNWDQDVTAYQEKYGEQEPERVLAQLAVNADRLATIFDRVRDNQWKRTGIRSDGSHFTVESLGQYFLHDPVHHLWDVEQGYESIRNDA